MASAVAAMRALRPMLGHDRRRCRLSWRSASSLLSSLAPTRHHIVAVDELGAIAGAEQFDHGIAALALDQPGLVAVEADQAAGDLAAVGIEDGDGVAALELAGDPGDADRQQATCRSSSARAAPASTAALPATSSVPMIQRLRAWRAALRRARTGCGAPPSVSARSGWCSVPLAMIMAVPAWVAILPASILVVMPPRRQMAGRAAGHGLDVGGDRGDDGQVGGVGVLGRAGRCRGRRYPRAAPGNRPRSWWRRGRERRSLSP